MCHRYREFNCTPFMCCLQVIASNNDEYKFSKPVKIYTAGLSKFFFVFTL